MKKAKAKVAWTEANQLCLVAEFARLKRLLSAGSGSPQNAGAGAAVKQVRDAMESPPAFEQLAGILGLSSFEREIVLLAAGVEMDSELAALCPKFTFGLAMAVLTNPHWSAVTPDGLLRRFRLVEMDGGHGLTTAGLRIDERVLHFLGGVNLMDSRVLALVDEIAAPEYMAEEHDAAGEAAARFLQVKSWQTPLAQFCGDDPQGQEDAAFVCARRLARRLFRLRPEDLAPAGPDLDQFALLWERETLLLPAALLIQCAAGGLPPSGRHLAERVSGPLMLSSREPVHLGRPFLRFDVDKPRPADQKRLWQGVLGEAAGSLNGTLDNLSEQFRLSARSIQSAGSVAARANGPVAPAELWSICRSFARPRLENLAQRITPAAEWNDLVLPDLQMQTLRHLAAQVKHRMKVYETWGFSAKGRRGLGVNALFCGESGTGKTLAGEVLARELDLDLYCIDLAAVVSKYIGETEKNLKEVFDAAEEGGALLLFDEADALFGKRAEVKDSRDRYANIEVGYLLQRMESYQGLAILTTNMKTSMDRSFQRRLRFILNFPFPDAEQREAIWARVFPVGVPARDLDPKKLAQLKVAGGSIRNIALNAAFLAAAADAPLGMNHLLEAAALEAEKMERSLTEPEVRGWV